MSKSKLPWNYIESPDGESTLPCNSCKKQTLSGYSQGNFSSAKSPFNCPSCHAGTKGLKVLPGGKSKLKESLDRFRSLTEGSLGQRRAQRKEKLAFNRGISAINAADRAHKSSTGNYPHPDELAGQMVKVRKNISDIGTKAARGGRWGTDGSSPATRKAERSLAAQEVSTLSHKIANPETHRANSYPYHPEYFFKRMRKHRETQGTGRQGDMSGIGSESRLPKNIRRPLQITKKAASRKGEAPKDHPSVIAAATKARLKQAMADRAQEKRWDDDYKKTKATPELKGVPWGH